jgi:hypothetical protein
MWAAADHKFAFTITRREHNVTDHMAGASPDPFFVVHVSQLDGSTHRRKLAWEFKTFDAAVRSCSEFTRQVRRRVAHHEAGHAIVAYMLGFSGVWIDMEDSIYRAITRYDLHTPMLAVAADGGYAAYARYLHQELMFSVAGTVTEAKLAGYPAGYVEVDVTGRPSVVWDAVRIARLEAGLPICGHGDCEIPFDAGGDDAPLDAPNGEGGTKSGNITQRVTTKRITKEDVAAIIKRAEDEVFALLKANWPTVLRVVNALCKHDKITSIEFDALMAGPKRAGKRQRPKRKPKARQASTAPTRNGKASDVGSSLHEQGESPGTVA